MKRAEESGVSYSNVVVDDFSSITGKGIKGTIDETTYYIESPKLFKELSNSFFDKNLEEKVVTLQNQGKTAMVVGTNKEILAAIAVVDEVRESSKEVIQKLHQLGIKNTIMLTDDNKGTANAIRSHVGVKEVQAELMPQNKLDYIKQLRSEYSNVALIGDGVNDVPALAASTVGIAMGGADTDTGIRNCRCCANGRRFNNQNKS